MEILNCKKEDKEKEWIWMMKGWKIGRGRWKKEGMDEIDEINDTIEKKEGMENEKKGRIMRNACKSD